MLNISVEVEVELAALQTTTVLTFDNQPNDED